MVECIAETGGEILLVPNGSPYWRDKDEVRLNIAVARVIESGLPLVYLNQVGGQDELVFDGALVRLNADRSLALQLPAFRETVVTTQWVRAGDSWRCEPAAIALLEEDDEADYAACVLGLRDYVDKNGFPGRGARPLRRHRLRAVRRDGGRCARARARARRDAALSLHRAGIARRCGRGRAGARHRTTTSCRSRAAVEGLEAALTPLFAGTQRATSPRRTCSRARAAPS